MNKLSIVYCVDGYNVIEEYLDSFDMLNVRLVEIQKQTADIFNAPFSVDVVVENIGRISIGLAEMTILCYTSADLEISLTSVGDISAEGEVIFYFGDYSVMSSKYIIPYKLALEILKNWIETGALSDSIEWTNELF